ncbi:protein EI24 homolog [Dioscorea cayenensis subsp. rotundata]|uniref:Protein EI24 homolog n=1 Tax=Dioscorea cayennensis subsp. rotundata TaxID=55577 RepID=A0AB40B911_DIOCR|nr:protein EI24 homolog [Dioscorea cayenensis subsp. rotundata]
MKSMALYGKRAGSMWLAGFREAASIHRVAVLCLRSRMLTIRMGQCFLLNGLIFLGSLLTLKSVVIPILLWILPGKCEQESEHLCEHGTALAIYSALRFILIHFFYVFWFYPLYVFSIVLSALWYNDIAKHGFDAVRRGPAIAQSLGISDVSDSQNVSNLSKPSGFEGVIVGIGEQVYSLLLLSVFFIEVFATGFIPYIGKGINFLLLSWMYSYYCFEYKWNLSQLSLEKRLDFFESNWAFFAGFGSPCVLAIFFFSPLVSYGVMAILFPLFVLTAAGTQAEKVIDSQKRSWEGEELRKLRIFYIANALSMSILQSFPEGHKDD